MTNYSLVDLAGLLLSTLSYIPLLVAPGFALGLAGAWRTSRIHAEEPWPAAALLAGVATLPVLDSLAVRSFGLTTALVANLALTFVGVILAVRGGWRPRLSPLDALLAGAWLGLVAVEWVDFDVAGGLHQPFLILDLVKHAATVQAIHDGGAPPPDPFFLRPVRVSYYYFFYTLGALSEQLCGGLADARAAVGGLVFWTGVALYALLRLVLARAAIVAQPWSRRVGLILLAVMAIGGLDIVPVVLLGRSGGGWLPDPVWWNEQVGGVLDSLIWVPHHVCALVASLVGLMALSDPGSSGRARRVVFAGACFASAFGLSVWVTIGAVATAGCWLVVLLWTRRWRPVLGLLAAGALALALAAPQLVDLHAGRGPGPFPIAATVRAFSPVEHAMAAGPPRLLARLVCLPLNYFADFGLLASGALLFMRERRGARTPTEFARILVMAAGAGLFIGAFFKSNLYNNDLGWRVVLFPLAGALVWTVAALEGRFLQADAGGRAQPPWRQIPPLLWGLGAIGLATSLYTLVQERTYASLPLPPTMRFFATDPAVQRDLRTAYVWADAHLPARTVLQHDPAAPRVFPFGLYGRNPTAVADDAAGLYGAAQPAVDARVGALAPIFSAELPDAAVRARARSAGVDALVVDASDPVWRRPGSWVWTTRPLFAAARARIIPVDVIGAPS